MTKLRSQNTQTGDCRKEQGWGQDDQLKRCSVWSHGKQDDAEAKGWGHEMFRRKSEFQS